ncbi:MAG: hypothetical protein NZU63_13325 [Gemmataceae bacterium]|nr:hypothetical protein [Gemmataceae bacterium]MDW8244062.1 hypothetical protein [Thermogemmata sp.]
MTTAQRALVRYGKLGWLGYFAADGQWPRGTLAVVQTHRGLELGEILLPALSADCQLHPSGQGSIPTVGPLLRAATPDDLSLAHRISQTAQQLLEQLDADSAWPILDIEATLDHLYIIHILSSPPENEVTAWLERWQSQTGHRLRLLDLSRLRSPAPSSATSASATSACSSCGDAGCGCHHASAKQGCSSGSCVRGRITPQELAAYFAQLRQQMESVRRYPLV